MAGINIDIAANTRDFQRGTKDVEGALDDVADALDHLAADSQSQARDVGDNLGDGVKNGARDAERSLSNVEDEFKSLNRAAERESKGIGDELGDGVKDGAKDADKALERTEKSFRELANTAKREDPGKPLGESVRRGTDDAKEGLNEFKDEANSTAKESAASFDGSFASLGDVIQEIAANAFAGFGPAGAVAGIAAAAGIGLAIAKLEEGAESTERFKERVSELTQELIDVGDGQVGIQYIVDKLAEMASASDDAEVSLSDLKKVADDSGSSYQDLARAYAGSGDGLDKLIEKQKDYKQSLEDSTAAEQAGLTYRDKVGGTDPRIDATQKYIDYLQKAKDAQDEAAENERLYAEANGPELRAKADLIENVNDAYDEAAGGADDFINKESGLFDVQGFIDSMHQREQALADYQNTLATAALTPEAKAFISSQGIESASTFMAGYKTATPAQQAELNRIWSEAGRTSSGAFSGATQAELSQAGYAATVKLNPDGSNIQAYLNQTKTQNVLLRVQNRIDLPARSGMGVP